jgi:HSP20 family protein
MAVIPKDLPDLLSAFQRQMEELFERFLSLEIKGVPGEPEISPPVDCYETAGEFIVEIELPGFRREDLSLGICRNMLIAEGFKKEEEKGKKVRYICLERLFGRFCRTVEIPPAVDASRVTARYNKGILFVTFPKIAEAGAMIKNIPIE